MRRLDKRIAGKIRNCDVWIGGNRKIFVAEKLIKDDLESLCDAMKASKGLSSIDAKEECAKAMHVDFEDIHPFEDGNGRCGRHIMNKHRLELGLPIHVIHEGKEQQEYYGWFK